MDLAGKDILRADLRARIERLIGGTLQSVTRADGGYTPTLRLCCATAKGRFFAKIGINPVTAGFVRREIQVYNRISGAFMPNLVACEDHPAEPILIIEDFSTGHWPPPWNRGHVERVLVQVEAMHRTEAQLEPFAQVHPHWVSGWESVAADPRPFLSLGMVDEGWLEMALPLLLEYGARCHTEGHDLCHWDLRSDNICLTPDRAILVDWNLACLSNGKLDLGFWLPSLAYEGGPAPEAILPDAPEVAAWVAGFFACRAGLPDIPEAPRVRLVQRQQLTTALPWAARALGLPLPTR